MAEVTKLLRKLAGEEAGVQVVGVAQQQQGIAPRQRRQQLAQLAMRPEDVAISLVEEVVGAIEPRLALDGSAELGCPDRAAFVTVLQHAAENEAVKVVTGEARERSEELRCPAMVEEADDVAEVEHDGAGCHASQISDASQNRRGHMSVTH